MKNSAKDYGLVIIGLIMVAAGLIMVKTLPEPQGVMRALPYVCLGIGCGVFGQGIGSIISLKYNILQ